MEEIKKKKSTKATNTSTKKASTKKNITTKKSTATKKAESSTSANKKPANKSNKSNSKPNSKKIVNNNTSTKKTTTKTTTKKVVSKPKAEKKQSLETTSTEKEIKKLEETKAIIKDLIKEEEKTKEKLKNSVASIFNQEYNKEPVEALNKRKKATSKKEEIHSNEHIKEKKQNSITNIFIIISIILCIIICLLVIPGYTFVGTEDKEKVIIEKAWLSENYVFLGDSITEFYDLKDHFKNEPVVNSGVSGYQTKDLLEKLDEMVYVYNPSKVFILIGTNDLAFSVKDTTIINNIKKIANEIKKNRPHTEIYIISIYPVNHSDDEKINHKQVDSRSNKLIREINSTLKEFSKEKKYNYIDLYSKLQDDDKELHFDYTDDGLHINDEGYEVITKEIKKYLK